MTESFPAGALRTVYDRVRTATLLISRVKRVWKRAYLHFYIVGEHEEF